MTLAELQAKANTKLLAFWNKLALWQEQNRLEFDGYRQLILTAGVVDGVDTDFEVRTPSDLSPLTIDREFSFTEKIPFAIRVDTWGNEPSRGFEATAIVQLPDGRKFQRSRSLTDTRTRNRDLISGSVLTDDAVYSDWYLSGADPVIETSAWSEVIEE